MSASLTFCLNKAHLETDAMNADVTAHMSRNDAGRLRITGIDVKLTPCLVRADQATLDRCTALFEDFCIVAQSLRQGIPVNVKVAPCSHRIERTAA
jgi:organic hydroperoxide reductase OsmC/OhrA